MTDLQTISEVDRREKEEVDKVDMPPPPNAITPRLPQENQERKFTRPLGMPLVGIGDSDAGVCI